MLCGSVRTDIYSYVFNCVEPSIQESALKITKSPGAILDAIGTFAQRKSRPRTVAINPQQPAALLLLERADCPWPPHQRRNSLSGDVRMYVPPTSRLVRFDPFCIPVFLRYFDCPATFRELPQREAPQQQHEYRFRRLMIAALSGPVIGSTPS